MGENGIVKRHAHTDCGELLNGGGIFAVRVIVCEEIE